MSKDVAKLIWQISREETANDELAETKRLVQQSKNLDSFNPNLWRKTLLSMIREKSIQRVYYFNIELGFNKDNQYFEPVTFFNIDKDATHPMDSDVFARRVPTYGLETFPPSRTYYKVTNVTLKRLITEVLDPLGLLWFICHKDTFGSASIMQISWDHWAPSEETT